MDLECTQEEKKRFGNLFRQKRQERGLSTKEVSHTLSIREAFIQAIEEGQLEKLLSPVHAQGFVKQYAAYLEMDVANLSKEFAPLFRSLSSNQEFEYGIGTMEMRSPQGGGVKLPNLLWIGGSIAAIAILWVLAKFLDLI